MKSNATIRPFAAALTAASLLSLGLLPSAAESAPLDRQAQAYPHITVQSDLHPSKTISAPVRRGPRGDEVRLPGGTWVPCGFNCYFTLRNATIDFWRRYDVFPQ
jgi:hypothetical protein